MRHLGHYTAPNINIQETNALISRPSVRIICIHNTGEILLLHTQRYNDYSLPGGGVDQGESLQQAAARELTEETGAKNISNMKFYGLFEEIRSPFKPKGGLVHMLSYCFSCTIDKQLGEAQLESYERNNKMFAHWTPIDKAITHNKEQLKSPIRGISLEREIHLLELIKKDFKL